MNKFKKDVKGMMRKSVTPIGTETKKEPVFSKNMVVGLSVAAMAGLLLWFFTALNGLKYERDEIENKVAGFRDAHPNYADTARVHDLACRGDSTRLSNLYFYATHHPEPDVNADSVLRKLQVHRDRGAEIARKRAAVDSLVNQYRDSLIANQK